MESINPKLRALLALTIVVAGVGAFRLFTIDDVQVETGFEQTTELPIVVPSLADRAQPETDAVEDGAIDAAVDAAIDSPADTGRNPFARADGEAGISPAIVESDLEGGTDAPSPGADDQPVFPDPALAERDPTDPATSRDLGADTSFEG